MHVDAIGPNRIGDDVVDIGDGCEVDDRIAASNGAARCLAIREVAGYRVDLSWRVVWGVDEVEDDRLVAMHPEPVDDVRTDEARAARDEDSHCDAARKAGRATGW
jgi:hypothetical protein